MILVAVMTLVIQAAPQVQVRQPDVAPIVDAVLAALVPSTGSIGGPHGNVRIGDRPLFVDTERSENAFRKLDSQLTFRGPSRAHFPRAYADVLKCVNTAAGRKTCRFADDGVYVAISDAQQDTTGRELLLKVLVLWSGEHMPVGYKREVFVRKLAGKWIVSRKGKAMVF